MEGALVEILGKAPELAANIAIVVLFLRHLAQREARVQRALTVLDETIVRNSRVLALCERRISTLLKENYSDRRDERQPRPE